MNPQIFQYLKQAHFSVVISNNEIPDILLGEYQVLGACNSFDMLLVRNKVLSDQDEYLILVKDPDIIKNIISFAPTSKIIFWVPDNTISVHKEMDVIVDLNTNEIIKNKFGPTGFISDELTYAEYIQLKESYLNSKSVAQTELVNRVCRIFSDALRNNISFEPSHVVIEVTSDNKLMTFHHFDVGINYVKLGIELYWDNGHNLDFTNALTDKLKSLGYHTYLDTNLNVVVSL